MQVGIALVANRDLPVLVAHSAVDALIALYPDAWEDPNEPVLPSHTRVVFPATMIVGTET